jgi:hypothetical protein
MTTQTPTPNPLPALLRQRAELGLELRDLIHDPEAHARAKAAFDAVQAQIVALAARKGGRR